MSEEECKRCNEHSDDLRTLWMECLYDMNELQIPLEISKIILEDKSSRSFYTMRVCKRCRSDWMHFIKMWYHIRLDRYDARGSGIFIRDFGAIIEVSEEQFRQMYPGIEPTRVIND